MTISELLSRVRAALADALLFPPDPDTAGQANDALQEVTRWAWLPPLSGVAIAEDRALRTHENAAANAAEQAEKTH
ncbi:hypothetical protein ACFVTE_23670 [Arthrobacter sp. NPDC058097]|uniref:hypothetical protein n=1 Tax=Arthrobacter sp. NPDC058097 TaxID=3346340 RepID=UPI0036DA75EA